LADAAADGQLVKPHLHLNAWGLLLLLLLLRAHLPNSIPQEGQADSIPPASRTGAA
jgi:hypothetical protein